MFFLAFATAFDMALTNMRGADEIGRPRASLGSAAISAVTTSLSPILPFAGGLDLRRDDYWSVSADGNWFGTLQSVVSQVQDAFSGEAKLNDRDRRNSLKSGRMLSRPQTPRQTKNHVLAIAAQQPFVQLDVISQLTLGDIGQCFNYAMISSDVDFNAARFLSGLSSNLQTVIQALQESVARSHGSGVNEWIRSPDEKSDPATSSSIDALKFSAAMRVFAEWRVLRQVPPGYKGFAMGMSLGHKDVVQNIIKMEEAVHGWIDYQQGLCELNDPSCQGDLRTPTLRDLLQYELDSGLHPSNRLPTLKEKSAGMGLLWVRRQLAYQTQIFDNVLSMNDGAGAKSSMKEAVGAAYMHVYGQYHGWAVQKIFNYSFQAAPEAEEILRFMNPHRLQELMQEQRKHLHKSESGSCESDSHQLSNQNPVQQLANHVGGEWDKFAFNVVKIFNKNAEPPEIVATCDGVGALEESGAVDEAHITREMVKDAHQQIASYLTVAEPLLGSLATMFDDLNMDDPTRV